MKHAVPVRLVLSLSLVIGAATPQDAPTRTPAPDQAELEARFTKLMSGCKMVGSFTMTGKRSDRPLHKESYTISKVEKLRGDRWRFHAKIEYQERSVTIPLVVAVRWAGDTPMIQVTDMKIPMLGTYTARVLIYRDRYAGTWAGKGYGGHMFGRIVRDRGEGTGEGKPKRRRVEPSTGASWGWRGPLGTGVAPGCDPPTEWSEDKNIRWKVRVPGLGISSPIVWSDRIFLTTAIETRRTRRPAAGEELPPRDDGRGRGSRRAAPTKIHQFVVVAIDRESGRIVWQTKVAEEAPHEAGHPTGSYASNSPVTDGKHIWAHFGSRGIHCLDMDGGILWSKDLGEMRTRNEFGEGSSPALYRDKLVINWDHEGDSFLVVLDKRTGREIWRRDRDEVTSWSTPIVVEVGGRPQVIVAATGASRGYDLETGDEIWRHSGMTTNAIPTPMHERGVVYLMSGFRGAALQAIRLRGARGDLAGSEHVLWTHGRNTSYVPCALLYDGYLYFVRSNNGVLSCLDAKTGQVHYEGQRLAGVRTIYSSPVGAGGRVYVTSRRGTTKVLEVGAEYRELATNELEDGFDASAAIVGDAIYLRGREFLYCIAEE